MYRKASKILWFTFFTGVVLFSVYITSIYFNWGKLYGDMPDLRELENPKNELASELYSADGVLLGKYYRENRSPVGFEELSPNLVNALLATEDIRFKEHSGIDFIGTIAIVWYTLKGDDRGSSTITQQLAKNLFKTRDQGTLTGLPRKVSAKFKEWILSIRIERAYTKNEIITMYLNTVDFGRNAFGIKVASGVYFGKTPATLNPQESAVLVGLLKAPTFYNPMKNPENALRRRNTVLNQMEKYQYITEVECDSLKATEIDMSSYNEESHNAGLATHFRSIAQKFLSNWCKDQGYDLYEDGLKIYTTIDSRMQQYAEKSMDKHMKAQQELFFKTLNGKAPWRDQYGREIKDFIEKAIRRTEHYRVLKKRYGDNQKAIMAELNKKRTMIVFDWNSENYQKDTVFSPIDSLKYYKHFLQAGMMSMEPGTGHIKAWVGGLDHKFFKYDHVQQSKRQPGSTFKPMVYATAIENGIHPCDYITDGPVTFTNPADPNKGWTPKNSDGYSFEEVTVRQALARSINTIAAKMVEYLSGDDLTGVNGAEKIVEMANELGIKGPLDAVPAICLGSSDVSIYEMVGAYSAFVNSGVWTEPIYITKIEDRSGKVIHEFVPKKEDAMTEATAYKMIYMLMGGLQEKGGTSLGLLKYDFVKGNQVGGKTGTTSNNSDAWYMGLTKDLVTGVWSGGDDRSIHFRRTAYGQGARQAMPAYAYYMEYVYGDKKLGYEKGSFPKPESISRGEFNCENRRLGFSDNDRDSTGIYIPPSPDDLPY